MSLKWNQQKQDKLATCSLRVIVSPCKLGGKAGQASGRARSAEDSAKHGLVEGGGEQAQLELSALGCKQGAGSPNRGQQLGARGDYAGIGITQEGIPAAECAASIQKHPSPSSHIHGQQRSLFVDGRSESTGTRCQAAPGQALRERGSKAHRSGPPPCQDGAATGGIAFIRTTSTRSLSSTALTSLDGLPTLPILIIPGQICYMNAVILVLWHLLQTHAAGEAALGSLLAPLHSLKAGLRFTVTDMLSWRGVIRNWFAHANTGLATQQDSAHFLEHLTQADVPLFQTGWQSVNVDGMLADQGLLPIRLELNSDLQVSLDSWHRSIHTSFVACAPSLLYVQLARYDSSGNELGRPVLLQPYQQVRIPCLQNGVVVPTPYKLLALISHIGETIHSGHYRGAISVLTRGTPSFGVTDDGRKIARVKTRELDQLSCGCYLLFFCRL